MATTKATNGKVVTFRLARITKGALLYQEVDADGNDVTSDEEGAVIRSFYLRKTGMAGEPQRVRLTIEAL